MDQPQSFCCPFCGKLGLTESGLPEHVTTEHPDSTSEVVSFFKGFFYLALPQGQGHHNPS